MRDAQKFFTANELHRLWNTARDKPGEPYTELKELVNREIREALGPKVFGEGVPEDHYIWWTEASLSGVEIVETDNTHSAHLFCVRKEEK